MSEQQPESTTVAATTTSSEEKTLETNFDNLSLENQQGETPVIEGGEGHEGEEEEEHPLQRPWALWYHNPSCKTNDKNYFNFLQKIYTVRTVENFWSLFNHIMKPSGLTNGSTYFMFVEGIQPVWEDPSCAAGGEWLLPFPRRKNVDDTWLNLVLSCIGEAFEDGDQLCGCTVAVRKQQVRVSIWIGTTDRDITLRFGNQMKKVLDVQDEKITVEFRSFGAQIKGISAPQHTL